MRQVEHIRSRWGFAVYALLSGIILLLFGYWCLDSTNVPPPSLALPFPRRVLTGLSFMLWNPFTLIPLALILTSSRFMVSKLSRSSSAAVAGAVVVLLAALWVPNSIILWPISVLGEHPLPELISKVFTWHVVPSPKMGYSSPSSFDALIRWQVFEFGARFVILNIGWTACIAAIWTNDKKIRTTAAKARRTNDEVR